jgi:ribonuclease BN (tRNA processing enzyme)
VSELVCIGTSDAFGAGGRRQSAYLLRLDSGSILLDCGQTTLTGLSSSDVDREEIEAIVVSHFHADHFGGIPLFLLGSVYADERRNPLRIVGPPGIEARVHEAARALGHPIDGRTFEFPLSFEELPGGHAMELGGMKLRAFETFHTPDAHPHGLLIEGSGRQIAYSGDTGWFDELPEHVRGSDLFLCECTLDRQGFEYHLSLQELADRREDFDCGRIVLTHLGAEMRARTDYEGFDIADDDLVLKL